MWIVSNVELGDKFSEHATRHLLAAEKLGIDARLVQPLDLAYLCIPGRSETLVVSENWTQWGSPKVCLFLDKDHETAHGLEQAGVRVVNSATTIEQCADKRTMHRSLNRAGIPAPKTAILARPYPRQPHHRDQVLRVANLIGYPLVVKAAKGSFGAQVFVANHPEELLDLLDTENLQEVLLQELITTSHGVGIRVHVVAGRTVAALRQQSTDGRLQANLTQGGIGESIKPSELESNLAIAAAGAVGAFYAGVDLLVGPEDSRLVCEVNSNAHVSRLSEITGIDCAGILIKVLQTHFFNFDRSP